MKLKSLFTGLAAAAIAAMVAVSPAMSAEEAGGTPHYPLEHPKHVHWSFGGPFGHWDVGQLQRGFKIYREVCSACHALSRVAFRNLEDLGYSEEQIKTIAADYTVTDGPNGDGEMYDRPGVPADRFPSPFPNKEAAASANNGAAPPDFSLLAKARAPERGFPWFIFDVFTLYAENGPDYIYSLLTGYQEAPAGTEVPEGANYNPYFVSGPALAMAAPLSDGAVTYDDGTPETLDQYARDVAAFMMWAAEPSLVERKSLGFKVMAMLLLLAILAYLTKKAVWAGLKEEQGTAPAMALSSAGSAVSAPVRKAAPKKAAAASRSGPERLSAPRGVADDLKMISGVGPKLEKTLNGLGFWHFAQIANWKKADIAIVDGELNFKGRIERDDWVKQAKVLAKGGRGQ
ncbi:MAG: cytochrome c1 [Nitratireductor sp.]|nr:cytochrome c1 [Nitratireductor sp.]